MKTNRPELYIVVGISGTGKTYYSCSQIDRRSRVFAIDPRGQISKWFKVPALTSRQEIVDRIEQNKENFFIIYKPGENLDIDVKDDWDFFFTMAYYMKKTQIIIDEADFHLKSTEYPASFRRLVASARTEKLTIYMTSHRFTEFPIKLRSIGYKVVFRIEDENDLDYLRGLRGFDKEEIMNLPDYKFVILPKEREKHGLSERKS